METISIKNIKENTLKLNQFALESTEKVVLKTIDKAEKLQNKTSNFLQNSLNFSDKQQDNLFNNLENGKKMIWKNLNKTLDFFNKN